MKKIGLFIILMIFLCGCISTKLEGGLYPIVGPLIDSGYTQKIPAIFTYDWSGHGTITMTMPDGEICQGEYTTYTYVNRINTSLFTAEDYTKFFGSASITSSMQYGQAIGYGDKGTIIQAEYYIGLSLRHGFGLAKDNRGNIYKLLF